MTSLQRREAIVASLQNSATPVSASKLARELGVSRQIVVGDVALLRASGTPVLATPRGYMLQTASNANRLTVACRHTQDSLLDELYTIVDCGCGVLDVIVEHPVYGQLSGQLQIFSRYDADLFWQALLLDELYTIVDCGCGVLDVIVEHPVYGQLSGQLQIFSRYDADLFWQALKAQDAQPLCTLTGDVHLHTLSPALLPRSRSAYWKLCVKKVIFIKNESCDEFF